MKLKTQTLIGFTVGVLITITAVVIIRLITPLPPPLSPTTIYDSLRIDGNIFKTLYNGSFSEMILNFKTISGTSRIDLIPDVHNSSHTSVPPPPGLIRLFSTGTTIPGDRILSGYYLEHNRFHGMLQLQTLDSIITRNPGGYFILKAGDYRVIDPAYINYIYYQIIPYKSDGSRINVSNVPVRALQIDPCPPAHSY